MENETQPATKSQPQPAVELKPKSLDKSFVIAGLFGLVIIVCLLLWYFKIDPIKSKPTVYQKLPQGYEFKTADAGKYPEGFPENLLLSVGKKQITRAENTKVASGENYKIVEARVSDSPDSLAGLYRNNLTNATNNWQLLNSTSSETATVLNFKKGTASLVVTIIPVSGGSALNLTYTPPDK